MTVVPISMRFGFGAVDGLAVTEGRKPVFIESPKVGVSLREGWSAIGWVRSMRMKRTTSCSDRRRSANELLGTSDARQ